MATTQQRNGILQRLDAALSAAESGDVNALANLIHSPFEYTFNGSTYLVVATCDSGPGAPPIVTIRIRKLS